MNNLFEVYKKHINPYPVLLVDIGHDIFNKRLIKMPSNILYVLIDNGIWQCYLDIKEWNIRLNKIFAKYKKDRKIIDKYISKFKIESKKFISFCNTFEKGVDKKNNKELLQLYKQFNLMYVNCFSWGEPLALNLNTKFEELIKNKILNENISLLFMPKKESYIQKEEKELIEVKLGKRKLNNHFNKFKWISVDYNGEAYSIDDFEKRLNKIKDPYNNLKTIVKKRKLLLIKQKEIFSKLDKETKLYCLDSQKCNYLNDLKKEIFTKSHYYVKFLMKEISKRINLTLEETEYLLSKEIEDALNNKKIKKNISKERYKKSAYISVGIEKNKFKIYFLNNKEEEKLRKNIKNNDNEIKGLCAFPGKVKGKARLIINRNDFDKMKKNEILVTHFTTPDFIFLIKKAKAIITDVGGLTSHAAIVSRELNKPCIVGTKNATDLIKDNDILEIDAKEGLILIKDK
jgi:phosphohistidine swiveling domain-containing protein